MVATSLLGQNNNDKDVLSIQHFDVQDGLEVGDLQSLVFDKEGWLWISGLESDLGASTFLQNTPKLQWFDGYNFHTVAIPVDEKFSPRVVNLYKRTDGLFYLSLISNDSDRLFLFDPSNLDFQSIPLPAVADRVDISNMFVQNENAFVVLDAAEETYLYRLNSDLSFEKLFKLRTESGQSYLYQVIAFDDHFLVSEARVGVMAYAPNGDILKEFSYEDMGLKKVTNPEVLALVDHFSFEDAYHFVLKYDKGVYEYDDQTMSWSQSKFEIPNLSDPFVTSLFQSRNAINDSFGNVAWFSKAGNQNLIKREYVQQGNQAASVLVEVKDLINAGSHDLHKELYLAELGRLTRLVFKNTSVNNFLEDYSIRSIVHYRGNRYLVATEANGFYLINVKENTVERFPLLLKGQPFSASEIRGVFLSKEGVWTNYNEGVLLIDTATHEVERFRHYPVSAMVDDGDRIVYGATHFPLMEFDKVNKINRPLSKNDSLRVLDLVEFDGSFYASTADGLFRYKDSQEAFVDIPIAPDELMMLSVSTQLGLLFTTNDGRVYRIKDEGSKPELIFTDPAASPIATVFEDKENNLWFATFAGLIKYNPDSKEVQRFIEDDGFSNNEFNRYSFLQTEDGGVFLGAIRGLNFFHPKDLKKLEKGGEVVLTSLTYFDNKSNANTNVAALAELNNVKEVSLPAENKFLRIQVAPARLTQPTQVNMEFKLNDGEWLPIKQPGEIQFNNLGAGQYLLKVRMVDSEGTPFGKDLMLNIHAKEFFYRTLWFGLLCLLLVVVVSYYFIRQANKARALGQHYSRSLLKVQEEERMRISRDLHDSVGQQLILLKNQANASRDQQMVKNVSATLEEVRSITRNLHPVVLSRLGLTAALEELIRKLDENTEVFFAIELENIDGLFDGDEELNLYRIIQEALNNIVKHANAVSAKLTIVRKKNKVLINIQDNGKGFSIEDEQQSSSSLGLKTLQERMAMLKGKVRIESGDLGTQIVLEIPLK
ncbi:ATP-binding protein [Roseivirga pacifica]|uniref:ATP-binding protein n=1 Tax=Roseivirga pacifica TaxID=1267423 RepID=UPI00227B99D3|nr:ATP-binding protein [Roseivirga pacifica]